MTLMTPTNGQRTTNELLHDIPPLRNPNMEETLTRIGQEKKQSESLLAIVHAGKELYPLINQKMLVSEPEIAERVT
jgi:hypothetical protein